MRNTLLNTLSNLNAFTLPENGEGTLTTAFINLFFLNQQQNFLTLWRTITMQNVKCTNLAWKLNIDKTCSLKIQSFSGKNQCLTRSKETQFFLLFIFLETNHWSKLFFCVFANCLQMTKHFVLGYLYENKLCNY